MPVILVDPLPRTLEMICDAATRARLEALGTWSCRTDALQPVERS